MSKCIAVTKNMCQCTRNAVNSSPYCWQHTKQPSVSVMQFSSENGITCATCGFVDVQDYCSQCGSKLRFFGDDTHSSVANLKSTLKIYVQEILDPLFAFFKTTWLLLLYPNGYLSKILVREKAIKDMNYPLSGVWALVSDSHQKTLEPIKYYIASLTTFLGLELIINFYIIRTIGMLILDIINEPLEAEGAIPLPFDEFQAFFGGFLILIWPIGTAFIFDAQTKRSGIPSYFSYSTWIYFFSLSWIVSFVRLIASLPMFIATVIVTLLVKVVTDLEITISLLPIGFMLFAFARVSLVVLGLTRTILSTYFFLISPYLLFRKIYTPVLSKGKLLLIVFASFFGPLPAFILLIICISVFI